MQLACLASETQAQADLPAIAGCRHQVLWLLALLAVAPSLLQVDCCYAAHLDTPARIMLLSDVSRLEVCIYAGEQSAPTDSAQGPCCSWGSDIETVANRLVNGFVERRLLQMASALTHLTSCCRLLCDLVMRDWSCSTC